MSAEPIDLATLENQLLAYVDAGFPQRAEKLVRDALLTAPEEPGLLGWLALTLQQQDRYDEALEVINAAVAVAPEDDRLHRIRSRVLMLRGDAGEAIDAAAETVRLGPENVRNLKTQANILAIEGRYADAVDIAERALATAPEDHELHAIVAVCQRHLRDLTAADQAFAEALRLQPHDAELWKEYSQLQLMRGRVTRFHEAVASAARADPETDVSALLCWPICLTFYRSRWVLALAAVLALSATVVGRVAAGVLATGVLADALRWPLRGGALGRRGFRLSSRAHRWTVAAGMATLALAVALLLVSATTGSPRVGVGAAAAVLVLWLLCALDNVTESLGAQDSERGPVRRLWASLAGIVTDDLTGLRQRVARRVPTLRP